MKPCPGCSFRGDAQALTAHITANHPQFAQGAPISQGDKPFPTIPQAPVQRVIHNLDTMNVDRTPVMNAEAVAAQNNIVLPPKPTDTNPSSEAPPEKKEEAQSTNKEEKDTPAILTYVYEGIHCGKKYDTLEVDVKGVHFVIAMCSGICRKQIKEMKVAKLL